MLFYIIAAVLALTGLIIFFVLNTSVQDVRNRRVVLFYLIFAVVLSAQGFFGLVRDINDSIWWFVLLQVISLLVGWFFHYMLAQNFFGELNKPLVSGISLLIANMATGFIGSSLLFNYFHPSQLGIHYATSVLTFIIPYGFFLTFNLLASIPPEIHKIWYYPMDMEEPDFNNIDLNKIYLLELEFSKSPHDTTPKNYKAKAPVDMLFGEWYWSFINNYNYKFEEDPIQFLDRNKEPHGWMFFTKPRNFLQAKRFIDPDLTIKANKITEKTVIVAKRVEVQD
jgi:hypothetical protein